MSYIMCISCNSSVLSDLVKTKMVCEDQTVGGICDDCMTNIRTFRVSFTRQSLTDKFTPLMFQTLEVTKAAGANPYDYPGETDN